MENQECSDWLSKKCAWRRVAFGEYPQSLKRDDVNITDVVDARGYYLGSDGYYYAKVVASGIQEGQTFLMGEPIVEGKVYYFAVEPLYFRVLFEDGDRVLLMCDGIVDVRAFDAKSSNYRKSDIRAWLNGAFLGHAFNANEKKKILVSKVDNSARSTCERFNLCACLNTKERIFLLSKEEIMRREYGFDENRETNDEARRLYVSDYARSRGRRLGGIWWTRSPAPYKNRNVMYAASSDGDAYTRTRVDAKFGVVPAMWIQL